MFKSEKELAHKKMKAIHMEKCLLFSNWYGMQWLDTSFIILWLFGPFLQV